MAAAAAGCTTAEARQCSDATLQGCAKLMWETPEVRVVLDQLGRALLLLRARVCVCVCVRVCVHARRGCLRTRSSANTFFGAAAPLFAVRACCVPHCCRAVRMGLWRQGGRQPGPDPRRHAGGGACAGLGCGLGHAMAHGARRQRHVWCLAHDHVHPARLARRFAWRVRLAPFLRREGLGSGAARAPTRFSYP